MKLMKKQVAVTLRTLIDDEGEKELSVVKQQGIYYRKKDLEVITFTEQHGETGEVRNIISIHPDMVTVKRSGAITMNQQFKEKKKSECLYRHPYGRFYLELYTKKIEMKPMTKGQDGEVNVEYDAYIDGQSPRHHHLTLTYMEEK